MGVCQGINLMMIVDYNPSDKWLKTVMKANEKNCQITSEKDL